MSDRNRNKLPNNLPQLQNLVKRDPDSYREEVSVCFVISFLLWTRATYREVTNTQQSKNIEMDDQNLIE